MCNANISAKKKELVFHVNILKQSLWSKKTIYTFGFFLLMIIDWTRGSQVGSTWAWTVNMTGIVMAAIMICQIGYKKFMKPIFVVYSIISIGLIIVLYFWWSMNQAIIYRDKLLTAGGNVWFLGLVAIYYIYYRCIENRKIEFKLSRSDVRELVIKHKLEVMALLVLLFMWWSVNEDFWPIWFAFLFLLFYFGDYSRKDKEDLSEGLLNGVILGFFFLQGLAFLFRPFDDSMGRYSGIYANYNMNALFYCIVWIIFKIKYFRSLQQEKNKVWRSIYYFCTSVMIVFLLFTICRTSWLVVLVMEFVSTVVLYFVKQRENGWQVFKRIIFRSITVIICVPIIYVAIRYIPTILHHPIWFEGEYSEDKVHSFDSWDSEKYVSFEEWIHEIDARIRPYFELILSKADNVSQVCAQEKKLNIHAPEFSSLRGRIMIWDYYLRNGTLRGHSSEEGHVIFESWYVWHTQNVFVQFWYYYGIPTAVLLLLYVIMTLMMALKSFVNGNNDAILPFLFVLLFMCYGMFEAVWYPGQMILLLLFLSPVFLKKVE